MSRIRIIGITEASVTIEWSEPISTGGTPITGYVIQRREGMNTIELIKHLESGFSKLLQMVDSMKHPPQLYFVMFTHQLHKMQATMVSCRGLYMLAHCYVTMLLKDVVK